MIKWYWKTYDKVSEPLRFLWAMAMLSPLAIAAGYMQTKNPRICFTLVLVFIYFTLLIYSRERVINGGKK